MQPIKEPLWIALLVKISNFKFNASIYINQSRISLRLD